MPYGANTSIHTVRQKSYDCTDCNIFVHKDLAQYGIPDRLVRCSLCSIIQSRCCEHWPPLQIPKRVLCSSFFAPSASPTQSIFCGPVTWWYVPHIQTMAGQKSTVKKNKTTPKRKKKMFSHLKYVFCCLLAPVRPLNQVSYTAAFDISVPSMNSACATILPPQPKPRSNQSLIGICRYEFFSSSFRFNFSLSEIYIF